MLWSLLLIVASLFVYLGLGGNFIIIGLAAVHALATGFDPITWKLLLVLLGIALVGEGIEFVVGTFYLAKQGATKAGVVGAFIGGLLGAALGNSVVPVVGAVSGSIRGGLWRGGVWRVPTQPESGAQPPYRAPRLHRPSGGHFHQARPGPGDGLSHSAQATFPASDS